MKLIRWLLKVKVSEPVGVYEVLDYHTQKASRTWWMHWVFLIKDLNSTSKQGSWDKAIKQFKGVLKANPNDICAQMYIERCDILKKRKPKKWDGVWVMTSK